MFSYFSEHVPYYYAQAGSHYQSYVGCQLVYRLFLGGPDGRPTVNVPMHRKRWSPIRSTYLPRLDFWLLVFTAYQIDLSWAYIFHATDPDLCQFLWAVRSLHALFLGVRNSVSRVQCYFYPDASCEFLKFLLIVGCLFLVTMIIGYKLALIRFRAHFSKSPTS